MAGITLLIPNNPPEYDLSKSTKPNAQFVGTGKIDYVHTLSYARLSAILSRINAKTNDQYENYGIVYIFKNCYNINIEHQHIDQNLALPFTMAIGLKLVFNLAVGYPILNLIVNCKMFYYI